MKHVWIWLMIGVAGAAAVPAAGGAEAGRATAAAATVSAGADDPQQAIAALRSEIARHDALYHREAAPEISDAEYDGLKRRLAELERAHPEAAKAVPALREIGDDRSGKFPTVRHRERMLSLEKAHAEADVRAFDARVAKALGGGPVEYVVEPKYDGLAVSVTYVDGKLQRAVTRGNGSEGDDITANVRRLRESDVPRELRGAGAGSGDAGGKGRAVPRAAAGTTGEGDGWPAVVEVRGEIYVPFEEFRRVNAEREAAGEATFANPRNLAAGTIRQLEAGTVEQRGLRAVFFGVGACEPESALPRTHAEWLARLEAWGLPVAREVATARGVEAVVRAVRAVAEAREAYPFPTDGAVVKVNALVAQRELGAGESAPRWALAYKFAPERVETQVRAITVQVGRTGVLTPVAELVPVRLGGSTVARATLHNREEIARRDVRVGDFVYLEKAGEIIPAVVGVNRARRPAEASVFVFPETCPSCASAVETREGEVAMRCGNAACAAQVRRRVEHFASKACVDIEGLGPAMIETLVAKGWVKEVADLYRLRRDDLLTLGKNNAKSVDALLAAIERSKRVELWRVIHGLGVPQIGGMAAKELARQQGSLEAFAAVEPRGRDAARALVAAGVRPTVSGGTDGVLAGKVFVMTGTLPTLSRTQATALIEAAGGKVATSVGRATSFVVAGAEAGAKLEQARKLGVRVIDEAELRRMVGER